MNYVIPWSIAGFFLAFILLGVAIYRYRQRKVSANLLRLAEQFGLAAPELRPFWGLFPRSLTSVQGRHRGCAVSFFVYETPGSESSLHWSAASAEIPHNQSLTLEIYPRGKLLSGWWRHVRRLPTKSQMLGRMEAMQKEGRRFSFKIKWDGPGSRTITCDDDNFNGAFVIKASDENFAKVVLTPEIRARLLQEQAEGRLYQLTIHEGQVDLSQKRDLTRAADADRLAAMLDFVCEVAARANAYEPAAHPLANG